MKTFPFSEPAGRHERRSALQEAVRATRAASGRARLSDEARTAILNGVQRASEPAPELFPAIFKAPRRLITAGALPLVLAAGLMLVLERSQWTEPAAPGAAPEGASTRIQAYKDGDQVYFEIANGGRDHRIARSTDPLKFDSAQSVPVVGGSYTETLNDGADIVYYRID